MIHAFKAKTSSDRAIVGLRRSPVVASAAAALAVASVLATASPALAAEEIWLRWDDCAAAGAPGFDITCLQPSLPKSLYVAACPDASLDQVVVANMVIDVVTDSATLPAWWKLAPGECRAGQLWADVDFSEAPGCVDAWSAAGAGIVQEYGLRPGGQPNEARFVVTAGVPGNAAATLPGGEPRALVRIRMGLADVGSPSCPGCDVGACLVLNSVELVRLPGAPGGDVTLIQPASPGSNFATWRSGAACITVPARNRSWGQIKALYR